MILAISVFGIELFAIRLGRPAAVAALQVALTPPEPDKPREEPDPSTYTTRGAPRLAETELTADPTPIDRFGFGYATPGGAA